MKTKYTFLIFAFFACFTAFSQQGINYKALIKNNLGNVVANQTIRVKFSILENTTAVYVETHTPTTNENGVIIINIGEGTTTDDFTSINWGSNSHFLKTEIDITGGTSYTDMGTTQFMAVPYALSAANVSGIENVNEGGNTGWRLIGKNAANYGTIGDSAIDLSHSNSLSTTRGATGDYASAIGYRTTASGDYAAAIGSGSRANENYSVSIGRNTVADAFYATAIGFESHATGNYSISIGNNTNADAFSSIALGYYNTGGGSTNTWEPTDPIFEVGNGSSANRTNALTILKNGTVLASTFQLSQITHPRALITKEYADANLLSGLVGITENGNTGWRLRDQNPNFYGDIGHKAIDLSVGESLGSYGAIGSHSVAFGNSTTASGVLSSSFGWSSTASGEVATCFGRNTTASGDRSLVFGQNSEASGNNSLAGGSNSIASGNNSLAFGYEVEASNLNSIALGDRADASGTGATAFGYFTNASGTNATALGYFTTASGDYSTSIGRLTNAGAYASVAVGRYNIGNGSGTSWVATDPLFEVGNGSGNNLRRNAFTILKNGNTGIFEATPDTRLHLKHANNGSASTGFKIENQSNNYWRFYVTSAADGDLRFYSSVNGGAQVTTAFDGITGAYFAISDRRHKTNFKELHFDWESFSKLQPLNYRFKKQKDDKFHLGMIAQDVESVYPELVSYNEDEDLYQLDYSGLGVIAIKAIQEQQKIITTQADKIKQLEAALLEKEKAMNNLSGRIEKIEALIGNGLNNKELTQNRN